jgi:hypothetical protein
MTLTIQNASLIILAVYYTMHKVHTDIGYSSLGVYRLFSVNVVLQSRTERYGRVVNTHASCSVGLVFKSRPGDRLS